MGERYAAALTQVPPARSGLDASSIVSLTWSTMLCHPLPDRLPPAGGKVRMERDRGTRVLISDGVGFAPRIGAAL